MLFFTRPPDSAVAAVQVKVDRGEAIITERGTTFLDLHPVFTFSHHGDYKRASKSSYLVD